LHLLCSSWQWGNGSGDGSAGDDGKNLSGDGSAEGDRKYLVGDGSAKSLMEM